MVKKTYIHKELCFMCNAYLTREVEKPKAADFSGPSRNPRDGGIRQDGGVSCGP